ncbi:MAG: hypothetical protein AB3N09_08455 [Tateyamaria sp.]
MIGVILWSDPTARKAVIWCEDQGDLAYLSPSASPDLPDTFFDVGDMVEFDGRTERNMRKVERVRRLDQNWGNALAQGLGSLNAAQKSGVAVSDSAEIIPFRVTPATRPVPVAPVRRQRQG